MSRTRLMGSVLLPFAAGYFLSYLFRTINAVIATDLAAELGLSAADLGLLTGIYFLVFAGVQLPLGVLLDRLGPSLVQSVLMLFASTGALVFATADSLVGLMVGRALIGLGVAVALMAGVKAVVQWFPPERLASATGRLVMLGMLGAVMATGPAELISQQIGWRAVFIGLAVLCALATLVMLCAAPDHDATPGSQHIQASFGRIFQDARFWRVAPLSAIGIGTSWSLQGLWAAPWLRDVAGLDRAEVVQHLSVMAIVASFGALFLGALTERSRRAGIKTETMLAAVFALSTLAQAALVLRWPLPPLLPWMIIALGGVATVLAYTLIATYFPKAMSGRANGALNLLHVGAAFVLQTAPGFVMARWPQADGRYPVEAHQAALAIPLVLQIAALIWFVMPRKYLARKPIRADGGLSLHRPTWQEQMKSVRRQQAVWRSAAIAAVLLCVALIASLASSNSIAHLGH